MSISTQTGALIDLYNQKISLDKKQLDQVTSVQNGYTITTGVGASDYIKIWGPSEIIENYNYPIKKLDNKIVELNANISNLQSQVLSVGQAANSVGCGSTGYFIGTSFVPNTTTTVNQDNLNYRGYSYTFPNPFSQINGILSNTNLGIGTQNYITQSSIGSYYDFTGIGSCVGYATSITNLNNQIVGIQSTRDDLINKVNFLKLGRSQYELQNYAYNQSKEQINTSIGISSSIISFLEDPNNKEWL